MVNLSINSSKRFQFAMFEEQNTTKPSRSLMKFISIILGREIMPATSSINTHICTIYELVGKSMDGLKYHKRLVFNWNHFEMRVLNLRINFYLLRTFFPRLGSFCVVSSFTTFRPNFTSGLLQVIYRDLG